MRTIALLCTFAVAGGGAEDPKPPAPNDPVIELQLRPAVQVRGLTVTVGDLCDAMPAGRRALAIGEVRFGPAPVIGHARTITRTELLQALAAAGHDPALFRMRGANEVTVQTQAIEVPAQDVADCATAALQAVLAIEGGDVEFELATQKRVLQAPPGRRSQELRARVKDGRTGPTFAAVEVDVLVDGERWRTVPVMFKLNRFQQVLEVTQALRAGTPLGPENVAATRERSSQTAGLYLTSFEQIAGMVSRRNLQPGQLLTLADVAAPALIRSGETCTVVLTRGNVKVTARAVANHDAPLGARITLTNIQSRAQLTGTVAAPGTVVVDSAR
jgi:flagella basal body P-ring formation protein FlgA